MENQKFVVEMVNGKMVPIGTLAEHENNLLRTISENCKEFYFTVNDSKFMPYLKNENLISEARVEYVLEQLKNVEGEKIMEENKQPECFILNEDPYPLCKGGKDENCNNCCLYEDYEEHHSPYPF